MQHEDLTEVCEIYRPLFYTVRSRGHDFFLFISVSDFL